jgi:nicotinic acid mononucleotide adenylyltransferase
MKTNLKNIFWFGFSADPPTLAHQKIVKAVLKLPGKKIIIVFPAGPLSYKTFGASKHHRLAMIKLWWKFAKFPKNVILAWFDFYQKEAWSWYHLWKKLGHLSPSLQHWYVVGADQYQEIGKTWDHGKRLLREARFLIISRQGYPVQHIPSHHHMLQIRPLAYSSTTIRKGSLQGRDPLTKAYILRKRVYD